MLGIPIFVNPSWFILFGLTTLVLATQVYPATIDNQSTSTHILMALVSAVLFFVSIILHELAHSAIARLYHIPVRSITLFLFGGVAQITRDATRPANELLMAIAGPFMSLVLGVLFIGAWILTGQETDSPAHIIVFWVGAMNIVLAVFNMLPAFPMDGGRVFRSLVWLITGSYHRATRIAAWTGRGFAWSLMLLGFLAILGVEVWVVRDTFGGMWTILMGFFIENAARQSLLQNRLVEVLGRYRAQDLMLSDPPVVDPATSVASLARGVLELNPRVCYFVEEHGRLAGIISGYQMRAIPEFRWPTTTAAEAMIPRRRLLPIEPGRLVNEVLLQMESEDLTHLPVVNDGRVIGVIGRDRILNVLRQSGLIP